MSKFVVRDREAGNIIDYVNSIEEGLKLIEEFEATDKADGTYTEDFYECVETEMMDVSEMTRTEMLEFVKNAEAWDCAGVIEAMEFLCKWYEIPMTDMYGEYRNNDDILSDIEKVID